MEQSKEKLASILLYLVDILSMFASYIIAGLIWLYMYKGVTKISMGSFLGFELGAIIFSYAFIIVFFNANGTFFKRDKLAEFASVIKVNLLFAALFVVVLFAKRSADIFSRGVYFLTIILNIVIMFILHLVVKYYLTKIRIKSKRIDRVLIITYSDRVEDIIKRVSKRSEYNRNIDGIVILDKDMSGETILDYPVVANRDDIIDYVKLQVMDEVLLDMPANEYKRMRKDIMELESMGVVVSMSITQLREFEVKE